MQEHTFGSFRIVTGLLGYLPFNWCSSLCLKQLPTTMFDGTGYRNAHSSPRLAH